MAAFSRGPVRVSVPATSANLGPGFDTLGLALDLRDELEAEVVDEGLVVEVDGEGAGELALDETHLVVRAMRAGFDRLGAQPPGLRLRCHNVVPHARGLGSSSSAIVGGLVLARALARGAGLDDDTVLRLAAEMEGHPDNVAPALLGGFVIAGRDQSGAAYAVGSPVHPRIGVRVFVPPDPLSTEVARSQLPAAVPHADAAANAGRAALLVAALAGRPDQLWRATRDHLHQEQRRPAMPASLALVDRLRAAGAAAVVSGAGPSVVVLLEHETRLDDVATADRLDELAPDDWQCWALAVDRRGAVVH